jgi:splicing factor U2AF subunit
MGGGGGGFGFGGPPPPGVLPPMHFPGPATAPIAPISYSRQSRRLYVGNITFEANEENLTKFFNEEMRKAGLSIDQKADQTVQSAEPVVSVQVNYDKNYAFVEVRFSSSLFFACKNTHGLTIF